MHLAPYPSFDMQACSTARLTVQVRLISYNNPSNEDCDGGNCEGGMCNNIFEFCLCAVGGVSCLSVITTNAIEDDMITFGSSELSNLGISNPLQFINIETAVSSPVTQCANEINIAFPK